MTNKTGWLMNEALCRRSSRGTVLETIGEVSGWMYDVQSEFGDELHLFA